MEDYSACCMQCEYFYAALLVALLTCGAAFAAGEADLQIFPPDRAQR